MSAQYTSAEENKAVAQRFWEDAVSNGNLDMVDEVFAPDFTLHDPENSDNDVHGSDEVKRMVETLRKACPDVQITIEDQMAAGEDKVVTRWSLRGNLKGERLGIPTSEPLAVYGISVSRISDGKIKETWKTAIGGSRGEEQLGTPGLPVGPGDRFLSGWFRRHW